MELQKVVQLLRHFAPLELAESWDNVGLLLEPSKAIIKKVFLTNDLTEKVLEEAIQNQSNMIISYHPPIFTSFKRLDQSHWKSRIVIKCIENRIALFSPHTSWDNVNGGVNDWLCKAFPKPFQVNSIESIKTADGFSRNIGRIIDLENPISIEDAIKLIKGHLQLSAVRVATPETKKSIRTIAICAGSGASVFKKAATNQNFDLYFTGEMDHHEVLEALHKGSYVVLSEHSNSERGFLNSFKETLQTLAPELEVSISKTDESPLETVV